MSTNEDLLVEHHIKRLRTVVRSGEKHLVFLSGAVRRYLRHIQAEEKHASQISGETLEDLLGVEVSEEFLRSQAIRAGIIADNIEKRSYEKIEKWFGEVHAAAEEYFPDAPYAEYLDLPRPPHPGRVSEDGAECHIAELKDAIASRMGVLAASLSELGEHEDVTPAVRDAQGGWPHLRGLIDDSIIDGHLRRMRTRRTRSEMSNAIGAAKEIVEATLKALVSMHDLEPPSGKPDLHDWWKILRPRFMDPDIDEALGDRQGALLKLMGGQISTVQNLSELRNKVGSGHGIPKHPAGLKSAHALLAVDTAHALTRFAVQASV